LNLRILKKLSKRAASMLPLLGDDREQFKAKKCESYISISKCDWKHWERTRVPYPIDLRGDMKRRPKNGNGWIVMRRPDYPLKGTVMVGEMRGYYEPEWDEKSAWESLCDLVWDHFTEWKDVTDSTGDGELPTPTCNRDLSTTKLVLVAAHEILSQKLASATQREDV
jgi:hypothetical protein